LRRISNNIKNCFPRFWVIALEKSGAVDCGFNDCFLKKIKLILNKNPWRRAKIFIPVKQKIIKSKKDTVHSKKTTLNITAKNNQKSGHKFTTG